MLFNLKSKWNIFLAKKHFPPNTTASLSTLFRGRALFKAPVSRGTSLWCDERTAAAQLSQGNRISPAINMLSLVAEKGRHLLCVDWPARVTQKPVV